MSQQILTVEQCEQLLKDGFIILDTGEMVKVGTKNFCFANRQLKKINKIIDLSRFGFAEWGCVINLRRGNNFGKEVTIHMTKEYAIINVDDSFVRVYRAMMQTFDPRTPEEQAYLEVNHKHDALGRVDKMSFALRDLEWATPEENTNENKGTVSSNACLNKFDLCYIITNRKNITVQDIAKNIGNGVSKNLIKSILKHKSSYDKEVEEIITIGVDKYLEYLDSIYNNTDFDNEETAWYFKKKACKRRNNDEKVCETIEKELNKLRMKKEEKKINEQNKITQQRIKKLREELKVTGYYLFDVY